MYELGSLGSEKKGRSEDVSRFRPERRKAIEGTNKGQAEQSYSLTYVTRDTRDTVLE